MPFQSILGETQAPSQDGALGEPEVLRDLNLDQVFDRICRSRSEYDLRPLFAAPLIDPEAVAYRHETLRELEREDVRDAVGAFAAGMRSMRTHLTQATKLRLRYQGTLWYLDAARIYCDAVRTLAERLPALGVTSRGFRGLEGFLAAHVAGGRFSRLSADVETLTADLADITYSLLIKGGQVTVTRYEGETDLGDEAVRTFAKFREGEGRDFRVRSAPPVDLDRVEAQVLRCVADLHPAVFGRLDAFPDRHRDFADAAVAAFDREAQFCLGYLEYVDLLRQAGLPFCYPRVCTRSGEVAGSDVFDIALAGRLVAERAPVVCNDFELRGEERILVVSGPNQGGKTTFARTIGQLPHLAGLGLPVPGSRVTLMLPDRIHTHFAREEHAGDLVGRLEDELVRLRSILDEATGRSVVIMNESFSSTTLHDARVLGTEILTSLIDRGAIGVYVTFIDELSRVGPGTVSMVASVDPSNPALRTFAIVRRPADGRAYAAAIAARHGLTHDAVVRRVAS